MDMINSILINFGVSENLWGETLMTAVGGKIEHVKSLITCKEDYNGSKNPIKKEGMMVDLPFV